MFVQLVLLTIEQGTLKSRKTSMARKAKPTGAEPSTQGGVKNIVEQADKRTFKEHGTFSMLN
jgi:hypothetical protein